MRKLLTTLAGVTLAVGLAAPAWADTAQKPAERPVTASGNGGHSSGRGGGSGGRGGGRDSGRNRRGSDRTGFDRSRRDDRYGSYGDRDRYGYGDGYGGYDGYYYDRYDYDCGHGYGYGYGYGYYGCNDPYGYGYGNSGSVERPTRFDSSWGDPPGEDRSQFDKLHHDDDSILF